MNFSNKLGFFIVSFLFLSGRGCFKYSVKAVLLNFEIT